MLNENLTSNARGNIFNTKNSESARLKYLFPKLQYPVHIFEYHFSFWPQRQILLFWQYQSRTAVQRSQTAADTVRVQLGDSSNKIGRTIQPVFTSTKNKDFVETRAERPPLIDQESIGSLFKRGLCDASYVGYTRRYLFQRVSEHQSSAGIGNHVKKDHNLEPMNLKGEMQESTWLRDIWKLCIRDLRPINNTQSITLIDMVSRKVTFLVTWHISPPYAQECTNAKTNLHICLTMTSDDVDKYNN